MPQAFLFLVNPALAYNPYPDWERWTKDLVEGRPVATTWNTGTRRRGLEPGDIAVVVKVGREPKGLVAIGTTTSEVYVGPHWNPDAKLAETGYVDMEIDTLIDLDDPLPLGLMEAVAPHVHWTPRQSGTQIDPDVVELLRTYL